MIVTRMTKGSKTSESNGKSNVACFVAAAEFAGTKGGYRNVYLLLDKNNKRVVVKDAG